MTLRAVVKAGGSVGVDRDAVATLVAEVARLDEIVLVHGASAETDRIAAALGVPQETITSPSGHSSRRTDRRTLEVFAMAALGVENFLYVEKLQQRGIDAVGLSGISGRLLVAKRKDVRSVKDGKTFLLRDDYTGTVEAVNLPLLTQFIGPGRVPVVAPLALSTENEALNVDGDRVAARIAVAIDADALLILTNVPGLLRDPRYPSSLRSRCRPRTRRSTSTATASPRGSRSRSTPTRCSYSRTCPVCCGIRTIRRRSSPRRRSTRPRSSRRAA
ncbi:MAG: [LysW]-aminoadipate kinase [Chloroflexi bacterium]|nr:MAG: [LysW]-aminoadipate kinase [Chloroflexota bacterium]